MMDYFQKQNIIFFDFLNDLFEFKKLKTWDDLAQSITELKMKRTYRKFAELFPRKFDYSSELAKLPDGFKTIHYGQIKGTTIIDEVVRFSLYSDVIVVFHPIQNPAITNQLMNPGKNPRLWLPDFLNALYFYVVIQKWVRAGIVNLIINPVDYDSQLYNEIIAKATSRVNSYDDTFIESMKEEAEIELAEQFASNLKRNESIEEITNWLVGMKTPVYTESEAKHFAQIIKSAIPKVNPLFQKIPRHLIKNQISTSKSGGPLESILQISELIGGNIFTPNKSTWKQFQQLNDNDFWLKASHIYSKIELQFLNNVSTDFALSIRKEGRLAGVRTELKKVFSELNSIDKISETKISYLYEGFVDEIKKAQTEWNSIKKESEIVKQHLTISAAAIPIMITNPISIIPIALTTGNFLIGNIRSTKEKQNTFRVKNPVSVFVDVQNREEGFFAQLKNCVL
ncbi:hypothetical protein [Mucilaginibacter sp.]|uniref:hypothetical protein n=1 Tax=Mucilaginibacter sp. TaxID=1882438 RepID=UPI00284FF4F4|nr:hypothetical protein [Mucilaginibacter sp.]MDR3694131.1 hypothetical protein [Mucilaginibacter sp.]